jgi:cytosine/adenosine deaminase-related metal-dependent hydrolase
VTAPQPDRFAVFGSHVLAEIDGGQVVLPDRWVLVEGRRIAAISTTRPEGVDLVLDRPGRFVLPGLINLHHHTFSEMIARTRADDQGGETSVAKVVYTVLMPLTRRGIEVLSHDERLAVARLGMLQLIKGGSTTVMEPFRGGIPEMFEAAAEMGLRYYGAPYLFSNANPHIGTDGAVEYATEGSDDSAAALTEWDALHARWDGAGEGLVRVAMSPHATDTCSPQLLQVCLARARDLRVPMTIHLAQSPDEVATMRARFGCSPTEYLDRSGVLVPGLLAAHCVCCSDSDLGLMAARGAVVLNCPRVFARGGIAASFARFRRHGVRTCVATDGYNPDFVGELGAAAMISKIEAGSGGAATAAELLASVTSVAAAAIDRPDLGAIRPGATADLTVIDLLHPHLQPYHDPRRALVSLGHRADLATVIVNGRMLVDEGRFLAGNEDRIVAAAAAAIHRLWDFPDVAAALQ